LDPVILALLFPTTLKRYCIQIFASRYFANLPGSRNSRNKGHTKETGFTVVQSSSGPRWMDVNQEWRQGKTYWSLLL